MLGASIFVYGLVYFLCSNIPFGPYFNDHLCHKIRRGEKMIGSQKELWQFWEKLWKRGLDYFLILHNFQFIFCFPGKEVIVGWLYLFWSNFYTPAITEVSICFVSTLY